MLGPDTDKWRNSWSRSWVVPEISLIKCLSLIPVNVWQILIVRSDLHVHFPSRFSLLWAVLTATLCESFVSCLSVTYLFHPTLLDCMKIKTLREETINKFTRFNIFLYLTNFFHSRSDPFPSTSFSDIPECVRFSHRWWWSVIPHEPVKQLTTFRRGGRGSTVVKALCYKSEGHWFDSRWCHWNFFIDIILWSWGRLSL